MRLRDAGHTRLNLEGRRGMAQDRATPLKLFSVADLSLTEPWDQTFLHGTTNEYRMMHSPSNEDDYGSHSRTSIRGHDGCDGMTMNLSDLDLGERGRCRGLAGWIITEEKEK